MKAIEMMAATTASALHETGSLIDAMKALLDLCYPCKVCGGRGWTHIKHNDGYGHSSTTDSRKYDCPACKGTGKGGKVLAVLDEKQEVPECFITESDVINGLYNHQSNVAQIARDSFLEAQQDMLKDGWRKTLEVSK